MIYLLDTNACVVLLRQRNQALARRLKSHAPDDCTLCAIVKEELFYGVHRSADPVHARSMLDRFCAPYVSLPYDDAAAEIAGRVRADLAALGTPIGTNDLRIAAIALVHDLTVVTHNTKEFQRVAGLRIADWEAMP